MRAIIWYFALMASVVWLASEGGFDTVDRGNLPITNSRPPSTVADLPLPDPNDLDDISVVPAAQAAEAAFQERLYVTGSVVNLRAGPGLDYRMVDVVERGYEVQIVGLTEGDWAPVEDPLTGVSGWINLGYVSSRPVE